MGPRLRARTCIGYNEPMKFGNFLLRLTLILLLWPVLLQAEQPEQVDCELIVGDWQGEYRPDNASFLTQDYAFHGA